MLLLLCPVVFLRWWQWQTRSTDDVKVYTISTNCFVCVCAKSAERWLVFVRLIWVSAQRRKGRTSACARLKMTFKRFNQLPLTLIFQFFNWKLFKFHNRISCCSFHSRDGWCGWWKTTQHNFLRLWMGISFEWILIPSLSFKWIKFENYDDSRESKAALLELNFIFFIFLVCTHRRLAANNYLFRHLKPCKMIHSFFFYPSRRSE